MDKDKKHINLGGWFWYLSGHENLLNKEKCGKWMYFFMDQEYAKEICQKAIDEEICYECKCTNMEDFCTETGVVCFYLNADDIENHKRIIEFMIKNNLIRRTKSGKLYNISFKYDSQTRAGEYNEEFNGKIKLEKFVDLTTGEWIYDSN